MCVISICLTSEHYLSEAVLSEQSHKLAADMLVADWSVVGEFYTTVVLNVDVYTVSRNDNFIISDTLSLNCGHFVISLSCRKDWSMYDKPLETIV